MADLARPRPGWRGMTPAEASKELHRRLPRYCLGTALAQIGRISVLFGDAEMRAQLPTQQQTYWPQLINAH